MAEPVLLNQAAGDEDLGHLRDHPLPLVGMQVVRPPVGQGEGLLDGVAQEPFDVPAHPRQGEALSFDPEGVDDHGALEDQVIQEVPGGAQLGLGLPARLEASLLCAVLKDEDASGRFQGRAALPLDRIAHRLLGAFAHRSSSAAMAPTKTR